MLPCTLADMFDNKSLKWVAARVTVGALAAGVWPAAHGEGVERVGAIGALFALGCIALHLTVVDVYEVVTS